MDDIAALVLRGLKFCGNAILVLLDITNTHEGLRALSRSMKRPKSEDPDESK